MYKRFRLKVVLFTPFPWILPLLKVNNLMTEKSNIRDRVRDMVLLTK